jgi:fatty-acyl-CoA synthase
MMERPLTIASIVTHAARTFGDQRVVSVTTDHPRHHETFTQLAARVAQAAHALRSLGVQSGDRVATLAWNDFRHLELYYAVSGLGAVLHTVNPRLFPEQIEYILEHGGARVLCVDAGLWSTMAPIVARIPPLRDVIVLGDARAQAPHPTRQHSYDALIAAQSTTIEWPELDERHAASLCYTSGTTGHPKGVLYSHRSTVLHALTSGGANGFDLSARDSLLMVVPMFHANAWGTPYSGVLGGAKLVLPGPKAGDGPTLADLIDEEEITVALGVPTVWLTLLNYLRTSGRRLSSLKRLIIGGSACPAALVEALWNEQGVWVHHAWGMTELSPLGTFNSTEPAAGPDVCGSARMLSQGRAVYGVELRIVDEQVHALPHDGRTAGLLQVRGPWVCSAYYRSDDRSAHTRDGWLATGDIATVDPEGYMHITDRAKDLIKSGGEWISSLELENIALSYPGIKEAAAIAMPHTKWGERPMLAVVMQPNAALHEEAMQRFFRERLASWSVPDRIVSVESLPHTATGKLDKKALRAAYAANGWPSGSP